MAPRDGSNVYSQPFPDVVEDTTIESTVYNGFTNDVAQDLNAPRPVVAGGTGGSSATDARFNLATEAATQLVTNYDDHLWVPGSFRSTSSATNPPVASHSFAGWCYINEALANPPTNQNVVVHAYDFDALATTSLLYTRQKKAGVWSNWSITTTEVNQAGARQAIYAAPFDAMAYNGMQINGSMEVSQELGSSGVTINNAAASKYVRDGWFVTTGGAQVVVGQSSTGVPSGFKNSLQVYTTTANAAPLAANYCTITQIIEGYRVSRLAWGTSAASPVTIGFWVSSTRTGLHSGSVQNSAGLSYVFSFTVNAVSTFEYKTVTMLGPTSGTWATDSSGALRLNFCYASGSNFLAASGSWLSGNYIGTTGTANLCTTTADGIFITGVVVLPGTEVPSAARSSLIMRPYDQELLTCQRYYETSYRAGQPVGSVDAIDAIVWCQNGTGGFGNPGSVFYKVSKRTGPIVTPYSPVTGLPGNIRNNTASADIAGVTVLNAGGHHSWDSISGARTDGSLYAAHYIADARL